MTSGHPLGQFRSEFPEFCRHHHLWPCKATSRPVTRLWVHGKGSHSTVPTLCCYREHMLEPQVLGSRLGP